jgi:cation diffusion facilitator CzcD-associated flavoprotein CzcO
MDCFVAIAPRNDAVRALLVQERTEMTQNPDAVIIGAGPAGLACAVTMRTAGLNVRVLEKADGVGAVWRRHYDRLHLHTDRHHSGLPGMAMPKAYPVYPSRAQVVDYLESYAAHFGIEPVFQTAVSRIGRDGALWRVETSRNSIAAPIVVVATGIAYAPYRPSWPQLETYSGVLIHSSEYRDPAAYAGKRALVIGFGNSGGEIALDLANAGVDVALAVRSPVQIIPRDLLGFPILSWVILYRRLLRALSTSSTRRCCGLPSAISKSSACAAPPKVRDRWSRRTGACR